MIQLVSFIHTGDLHLGLQFKSVSFDKEKAKIRREELWGTFERIVDYSAENDMDFLFIAGDLFEDKYFTLGDIRRIRDILSQAENVQIIIIAGNHDYMGKDSLYSRVEWGPNTSIFSGKELEYKDFPEERTRIYGYSWDRLEIRDDSILDQLPNDETDYNKIMILHGDVYTKSNYLPLSIDRLKSLNMDYIGLGHIHKPEIFNKKIAYCGSPEPLDFGETGERGFIQGRIEDGETNIEFVPFSRRSFYDLELEIDETMSYLDICNKIKTLETGLIDKDFYRIKLKGYVQNDIDLSSLLDSLGDNFYYLEIIDNTIPDYDLELLENDYKDNIIGMFIKEMKEKGLNDPLVKDSLYKGLEALLKGRLL